VAPTEHPAGTEQKTAGRTLTHNPEVIMEAIKRIIGESIATKQSVLGDDGLLRAVDEVTAAVVDTLKNGGKALFCGNGGSAADAQHIASELSARFYLDREPLYGEALHVNTSHLTAVANDYGYEQVFARQVKAKGRQGDILFCLSTSGNSPNVVNAAKQAVDLGMITVGMTGKTGGVLAPHCQYMINIPSQDTPRIQESHILIGHIICELVEQALFSE
jgi:D-sedoheptulose 7-phosphate isomerase